MDEKKVREAIEDLKGIAFKCEGVLESLPSKEIERSAYKNIPQSIYTAIEALEKQLPKKPIFQHMIGEIKWKFKCPCCNNLFTHECPTFPYEDMEHCSKCGQKLDWSE